MSAETAPAPERDPVPPARDLGTPEPKKKKPEVKAGDTKPDGDPQPMPSSEEELQDYVFFPAGRTPVLEEIHNQAQEGLKSLQRKEKQSKSSPQDENTNPQQPHETSDNGYRARSQSCTTENTDDALSVRSEMIQRKGSTFRPYDLPRSPSVRSGRKRKEKRATVVGIPNHIAAELGIQSRSSTSHRGIHELFSVDVTRNGTQPPVVNGKLGTEEGFVVIPTVDGNKSAKPRHGAHVSLTALEQNEAALQRHIDRVYQDDSCLGWKSGPKLSPLLIRPKSLAVPGMTTHSPQNDPGNPVMCMSPQATYLSKIIPNAVLPPMVDVVALSNSSVRTLSRCSLATASPASVRGSFNRGRGQSVSSDTWSRSQSTETIVSDSSTISSHGENLQDEVERHELSLSTGRASPAPSTGTQDGSDAASLCSGRSSVRSVSLRKSKKAPPPPKRTYSLQQQREMGLPPRPERKPVGKHNNSRDPWVLRTDGVTIDNMVSASLDGGKLNSPSRSDRTLSPSSGYSSQSGTPTLPVKHLLEYPESPGNRRKTPPKPERSSLVRSTVVVSMVSSPSSEDTSILGSPAIAGSSMGDQETQIIPPHPKVPAPSCPPPGKILAFTGKPGVTPPPSPPPTHHPTPPPARKSESEADTTPSRVTKDPSTRSDHVTTMANREQELLTGGFSQLIIQGKSLTMANSTDTPSAPVLPLNTAHSAPVPLEPSEVPPINEMPSQPPKLITYKPHFVNTPKSTTVPIVPFVTAVPQHASMDQTDTTLKQTSTALTMNTVSNSVTTAPQATVAIIESAIPLVPDIISPGLKRNVWKPVSAPGGSLKKALPQNQTLAPSQKEDANLPIVTPSLLQMVRLRSVQARGPQVHIPPLSGLPAPQKPIRKSLSQRSPPGPDSPSGDVSASSSSISLKPQDSKRSPSPHRSPASAASFVFARGSRKFVFEPPTSQEAEASLKKDLVTELKSHGGPRSPDGKPPIQRKPSKIPPPVARKPSFGVPRTPTSPGTPTSVISGSTSTPSDTAPTPPANGTTVAATLAGHEQQHQDPVEQA
uniref:NHS like 3 n=1 Tax=Leptobrachium leishanense TaxID=445787 RepID=A0A8C5LZM3_9ANUR